MQPTTPTPVPVLPVDFFAQAYARWFSHPMPKFFQILLTLFGSLGTALAGLVWLQSDFAAHNEAVPEWLIWSIRAIQGILYVSGIVTAKLTIQTPSTPPLAGDIPEPTVKELAAQVAALQAQLLAAPATTVISTEP